MYLYQDQLIFIPKQNWFDIIEVMLVYNYSHLNPK